jgi:4-azaleucine resistance transporter AzlC
MRSIWRTLDRDLARDVALLCLAVALVGISFGAITVSSGLPVWLPTLMSIAVFAGAAQFMFVGIVAAGGNPIAAVAAGLLVNARHLPFGFAVWDVLGTGRLRRLLGTHLMVDETVAFALAQPDPQRRRRAYWVCGIGLFGCWNVGAVAGAFGGTLVSDTDAFGLDAAFPAVLLALILQALRDPATRRAVLLGAGVALAVAPFAPAGVAVLAGLTGVVAGLPGTRDTVSEGATR